MVFDDEGIDLANWQQALDKGEKMNLQAFVDIIRAKNLRNAVLPTLPPTSRWHPCMTSCCLKAFQWLPAIKWPVPLLMLIIKN
jgi:hypothetical protein